MNRAPAIVYRLPVSLRDRLREPFAPVEGEAAVVQGAREGRLGRPFIAVGDIVAVTLLRHGLDPEIIVYDLGTRRQPVGADVRAMLESHPARRIHVENPAATITAALVAAIQEALRSTTAVKIHVDGEEDLATLPCIVQAPAGGTVIYGMPNRGLVPVPVSPETRARAEELLSLMKV